ncbi:hypothetical protein CQW23_13123 [Capsicum baccatum]|uniref:PGG domain-containing protein n=1 Tax=Capsicum baccatum TaxID=33114 RepID=A0A2G2WUK4_CAPBA|nr:hypothetical protein CQW23_13123 [Capsicum baccatum]
MDPTLYNAAVEGNISNGDFSLAEYLKRDEENPYQFTPIGNTILHVAAHYGHCHFVAEVLKISPALLCHRNKKNETALHIAANEGHIEVVHSLLSIDEHHKEKLMRMTDDNGDTALHKAVRSRHQDVARLLVKEDPEFEFPSNKARETPLYLAAESGLREALSEILNACKQPTSSAGPLNRTPLHAAVIQEHTDCARLLMQWNKSLCEEPDVGGWNSLHFAALLGLKEVVSDMLGWKRSLAYLPAGSDNDWTTAIHIAAGGGKVDVLHALLNHCPDCWEMLDSNGRNALHIAIFCSRENVVSYLLKPTKWDKLVEDPDNDGNTPLHLLASSNFWGYVPLELKDHPRAKKMSYNKENKTPFDVAVSCTEWTADKDRIAPSLYHDFLSSIAQLGRRSPKLNQMDLQKIIFNQAKERDTNIKGILSAAQMQLVVATLLVTVTFAAGFTLPGGFESDDNSPNKGMAVLIKKTAFRAFVITDAIAFACSAGAIFSYFYMATNPRPMSYQDLGYLWSLSKVGARSQLVAMSAVVIAFVTGMYATLAHSVGLAVTVCAIGCISFIMYVWAVLRPVCWIRVAKK